MSKMALPIGSKKAIRLKRPLFQRIAGCVKKPDEALELNNRITEKIIFKGGFAAPLFNACKGFCKEKAKTGIVICFQTFNIIGAIRLNM